jgi:hypothetical protein
VEFCFGFIKGLSAHVVTLLAGRYETCLAKVIRFGDELAKVSGREREHVATQVGKLRLEFRSRQARAASLMSARGQGSKLVVLWVEHKISA